jgi:hypothetical protein
VFRGIDPVAGKENRLRGSRGARRPAVPVALFSAVHVGGEQGWESGHLELESKVKAVKAAKTMIARLPRKRKGKTSENWRRKAKGLKSNRKKELGKNRIRI